MDATDDRTRGAGLLPRVFLAVTLGGLLLDGALRLGRLDPLAFRAWEALRVYRDPGVPFEENRRYENARTYGDLANLANLPGRRRYRPQVFTTDARGYRNLPEVSAPGSADALLVGTSYSAGNGVSDAQTLSVRLSERSGKLVYNAGGRRDIALGEIRRLARELRLPKGAVVFFEHLERNPVPSPGGLSRTVHRPRPFKHLRRPSVLAAFLRSAYRRLQNDVILPNVHRKQAVQGTLPNGETMLFWRPTFLRDPAGRDPARGAAFFSWLAGELAGDGLRLVVLLVPDKITVYGPLLEETGLTPPPDDGYLDRMAAAVQAGGVPAVSMVAAYRRLAARGLERGEYLYWPDDTHWNARGVEAAADALWRIWRTLPE